MAQTITQKQSEPAASTPTQAPGGPRAGNEIDLQALAQKVYDLLRREARLERERLGVGRRRR